MPIIHRNINLLTVTNPAIKLQITSEQMLDFLLKHIQYANQEYSGGKSTKNPTATCNMKIRYPRDRLKIESVTPPPHHYKICDG